MPAIAATPVKALLTAILSTLGDDEALQGLLGTPTRIFTGRAPRGTTLDYVVIVDMTDAGNGGNFEGTLSEGRLGFRIWSKDTDALLDIYSRLQALLARQYLAIVGYTLLEAKLELQATIPDPSAEVATQGVVNYEWRAQIVA